jgi:hypothetical protein
MMPLSMQGHHEYTCIIHTAKTGEELPGLRLLAPIKKESFGDGTAGVINADSFTTCSSFYACSFSSASYACELPFYVSFFFFRLA